MWVPSNNQQPGYVRHYGEAGAHVVLVGEILAGGTAWRSHAEALADRWRVTTVTPLVTLEASAGQRPAEGWTIADEAQA